MIESNTSPVKLNDSRDNIGVSVSISDIKIRIAGIEEESIVDGPGIRLVVFTQGCSHKCKGCHNPETHNYNGGYDIGIDDIIKMVKSNPLLDGITISGGDPFEQAYESSRLAKRVKELGLNVIIYTGYRFEEIISKARYDEGFRELLLETDILIDGRFEISKKDLTLPFRGSKNQRMIDVKNSLINKKIILYKGENIV